MATRWAENDPAAALRWVETLSPVGQRACLEKIFSDAVARDPAAACLLAGGLREPEARRIAFTALHAEWRQIDAAAAAPERGGGQDQAIASYERGLETLRKAKPVAAGDLLEPAWGEPELHMSLAWSQLNRKAPDVAAAERHARAALALVPHWHYVRDILLPQIETAKSKAAR